ncbi:Membrane-associated progesterone receptor component 1 [Hondaea fermentalgiana]|uniref:Membrane-associated progesterone receptor component 1 n=1 Tax=Hondaea fermentalgiana TaxID=2315210 RepID=A0A2R5GTM7_9STRA|nr:Membrane-associated progesterone receptor component 1 [Hondaea fermentalgiana]|eukprot:GBG33679.1 Membrane-associated progesterone receptor component 1 [Hondaea fermentalgiana]
MRRLRDFSRAELAKFNGHDGEPVYIALKGVVFDVSSSGFYGPDGGYALLAGRDASRALAKMKLDPDLVHDPRTDDLSSAETALLTEWYDKLSAKYPIVGSLR